MMKLNKQVPNLELCKKLKELGYPQEGLFWYRVDHRVDNDSIVYVSKRKPNYEAMWTANLIVAPTVAEMGEILPSVDTKYWATWSDDPDEEWCCEYWNMKNHTGILIYGETEVDSRAKMLIYLLENKLISLEGK